MDTVYHFIANPQARRGKIMDELRAVREAFRQAGKAAKFFFTEHPRHAIEIAEDLARSGAEIILSCGGDGTAFEVVNGIMRSGRAKSVRLGIIPLGTGNSFMRDFGVSSWRESVERIFREKTIKADIGRIIPADGENSSCVYFHNMAAFGTFAEACKLRHGGFRFMGKHAYNAAFLYLLTHLKLYPIQLAFDGSSPLEFRGPIVAVCNSQFTGHDIRLSPSSRIDDGRFEAIYVEDVPASELFKLFLKHPSGQHLNHPKITVVSASRIDIRIEDIDCHMVDGELFSNRPLRIDCLPQALEIFT